MKLSQDVLTWGCSGEARERVAVDCVECRETSIIGVRTIPGDAAVRRTWLRLLEEGRVEFTCDSCQRRP